MEKKIITISREFGSGGRTIGRQLAEKLGIPFYDEELVDQVALESGFAPKFIEEHSEHSPGKSFLSYVFADFLWSIQCSVILQLAEKGPCIIVGRNADYVLKDRDDCLHAFIYADMDYRADRIVRLYGESEKSPETRLQEKDKRRKVNYQHYTGRSWGQAQNYDVCLCSSTLGEDRCVEILLDMVKNSK